MRSPNSISCATAQNDAHQRLGGKARQSEHLFGARLRSARPALVRYLSQVIDPKMFEELRSRIDEAFRNSPAQDIEKNLRALLSSWFERLDLVLREDFEVQKKLLERAQAKLVELEARVAELEGRKPK